MTEDAFANQTIAIIGLGLIGGSLALALHERKMFAQIIAVDKDAETCAHVIARGIQASTQLDVITQADVIVLATPVRTILALLPKVGALARRGTLVMDLGSTKYAIVQAMNQLPTHLQVIGAHPLCGKERAGFGAADARLFQNAVFALTPLARTTPTTLAYAQALVQHIGACPLIIEAERHDRILAVTSHLPYLLAVVLMRMANERARDDAWLFTLAASGFRDTSRLAASETTMMLDILMTNRANITALLRAGARQLEGLADAIDHGDESTLHTILNDAANQRRKLFQTATRPENTSGLAC